MKSEHTIPEPKQFETVNVPIGSPLGESVTLDMPEIFAPDLSGDLREAVQQGADLSGDSWRPDNPDGTDTYVVRVRKVDGVPTYFGVLHLV